MINETVLFNCICGVFIRFYHSIISRRIDKIIVTYE